MNIQKILRQEQQYNYLDRVQGSLSEFGLTFSDIQTYRRAGRAKDHVPNATFKHNFGKYAKLPPHRNNCLCGHYIKEQCYLCPEESNNVDDIIVVGNSCVKRFGFEPALRGKLENKLKCDLCGSLVNKKGIARHKKTSKCKHNRDTSSINSNCSTSVGSDSVSI